MTVDIQNNSKPQEESKIYSIFEVEKRRYKKKGLFLIPAVLLWICFFILLPTYGKLFWAHIADYLTKNLKVLYSPIMTILHSTFVFAFYGLFSVCYNFKSPIFEKWRANPNAQWPWEKDPQDWAEQKKKTYKQLAFHHFVIFPLVLLIDSHVIGLKYQTTIETFPTMYQYILFVLNLILFILKRLEFGIQIYVCVLAEDFGFYWSHYFLHHPKLYNTFHKKHHEYNISYSIVAEYSNTFEYVFGNIVPSILGIKIMLALGYQVHMFTGFGWLFWRLYTTAEAHSGYEVPFSPLRILPLSGSTYLHDFHHQFNSGAYGSSFVFWDHLMKSDRDFLKYRYYLNDQSKTENLKAQNNKQADQNLKQQNQNTQLNNKNEQQVTETHKKVQ